MGGNAAKRWIDLSEAFWAQRDRLRSSNPPADIQAGNAVAQRFDNPRRDLDAPLAAIASDIQPDDVVIDVGGGAGRVGLPLALRCREVVNVDPSPAMKVAFEECAKEASITNVRFVPSDWLNAEGIEGDVVLSVYMIEIVRDMVPFIQKLEACARRRVIITTGGPTPQLRGETSRAMAEIFRQLFGEERERRPTVIDLFPVLWEMGILPDVRIQRVSSFDFLFSSGYRPPQTRKSREEAIDGVATGLSWISPESRERARALVEERFDELFVQTPEGFSRKDGGDGGSEISDMLITWETQRASV